MAFCLSDEGRVICNARARIWNARIVGYVVRYLAGYAVSPLDTH